MYGKFNIKQAITIEELEELTINDIKEKLIKIEDIFKDNPKVTLNEKELLQFFNGVKLKVDMPDEIYKVYGEDETFIGIGVINNKLLVRDVIMQNVTKM